jgi:hypothetical protein
MENKIYIIVVCMLAVDLFSLLFIPMISSPIKKYNNEVNDNFRDVRQLLYALDKRQTGMHLELVELNVETKSRRTNPHYEETKKAIHSLLDAMEQLSKNQGVLDTRLKHTEAITNTLKELQYKYESLKISKDTTHLQIQINELAKERDFLKSQIEALKNKNNLKNDEVWDLLKVPMPKGALQSQKEQEPKKKRKYSFHAYNTPERMKELRRLKALKKSNDISTTESKNEVEKIKRNLGRPKGSKNNNNQ